MNEPATEPATESASSRTSLTEAMAPALGEFVSQARWFGGKGRTFTVTDVRAVALHRGEPRVSIVLATVTYLDGGSDLYQLPIATYEEEQERLEHALITVLDGRHVYDALHDRQATPVWLAAFAEEQVETGSGPGTLSFHRRGDHELDTESRSTLFSGEQSNSSVAFGEDSLMKVFRRVTPGVNPDIEIHRALSETETTSIAELYGWVELQLPSDDGGSETLHLAMLQQFLRTASDGFDMALASARNLFAEADLHAEEVGGDFAAEAHRLGLTVCEVHALLREQFPTEPFDAPTAVEAMRGRLAAAVVDVPDLAEHAGALEAVFASVSGFEGELSQRIHGDLHLGQTLRTSLGWKLVDFEGEPVKSLAERRRPDSPWRDVAGMLRSFDYAAQSVVKDLQSTDDAGGQIRYRAQEWLTRNRQAFLDGYVEQRLALGGAELSPAELALINAYEADKAVYEVLYEARNRPGWLDIPLSAIERIGGSR